MAKILTDKELAEIVNRIVEEDLIDDQNQYFRFLEELATVLTNHLGGRVGMVDYFEDTYYVGIHADESVPTGGGIWMSYDKDINDEWLKELEKEGVEKADVLA